MGDNRPKHDKIRDMPVIKCPVQAVFPPETPEKNALNKPIVNDSKCRTYIIDQITNPQHTKAQSKQIAGYSPGYRTAELETTKMAMSIRAEVLSASKTHKTTVSDCLSVAGEILHNKDSADRDRLTAVDKISKIGGYNAPLQLESKETKEDITVFMGMIRQENISVSRMIHTIAQGKKSVDNSKMIQG